MRIVCVTNWIFNVFRHSLHTYHMQIILASAKIMHDKLKSTSDICLSKPRFQNEAEAFARVRALHTNRNLVRSALWDACQSKNPIIHILSSNNHNNLHFKKILDYFTALPADQ